MSNADILRRARDKIDRITSDVQKVLKHRDAALQRALAFDRNVATTEQLLEMFVQPERLQTQARASWLQSLDVALRDVEHQLAFVEAELERLEALKRDFQVADTVAPAYEKAAMAMQSARSLKAHVYAGPASTLLQTSLQRLEAYAAAATQAAHQLIEDTAATQTAQRDTETLNVARGDVLALLKQLRGRLVDSTWSELVERARRVVEDIVDMAQRVSSQHDRLLDTAHSVDQEILAAREAIHAAQASEAKDKAVADRIQRLVRRLQHVELQINIDRTEAVEERVGLALDKRSGLPVIGKGLRSLVRLYLMQPPPMFDPSQFKNYLAAQQRFVHDFRSLRGTEPWQLVAHAVHPFSPNPGTVVCIPNPDALVRAAAWTISAFVRAHGAPSAVRVLVPSAAARDFFWEHVATSLADMNLQQLTEGMRDVQAQQDPREALKRLKALYTVEVAGGKTKKKVPKKAVPALLTVHIWPDVTALEHAEPLLPGERRLLFCSSVWWPSSADAAAVVLRWVNPATAAWKPQPKKPGLTPSRVLLLERMGTGRLLVFGGGSDKDSTAPEEERLSVKMGTEAELKWRREVTRVGVEGGSVTVRVGRLLSALVQLAVHDTAVPMVAGMVHHLAAQGRQGKHPRHIKQVVYAGTDGFCAPCTDSSVSALKKLQKFLVDDMGFRVAGSKDGSAHDRVVFADASNWDTEVRGAGATAVALVKHLGVDDTWWQAEKGDVDVLHLLLPITTKHERLRVRRQFKAAVVVEYNYGKTVHADLKNVWREGQLGADEVELLLKRMAVNKLIKSSLD